MKYIGILVISICVFANVLQGQITYMNCPEPPADSAVVFAPGVVSQKVTWEEKICFTPDGKEMFFGRHPNGNDYFKPVVMHSAFDGTDWSEPDTMHFSKNRVVGWPLLSPDGNTLYMEQMAGQIVYSKRTEYGWSEINSINPPLEAEEGFGLAQITNDSTFYFYDRVKRIAYYSKMVNGIITDPVAMPYTINPAVEFFVSPKNDYIIFTPIDWGNPAHISYKIGDNEWSMPIPLFNYFKKKKGWVDRCKAGAPYVSPDGKYFFFLRHGDIYWVKTDFIEALRKKSAQ